MNGFMDIGETNTPDNNNADHGRIGTVFGGRYQIIELLGRGGMADVYLAKDNQTQKEVAIKILKSELTNDEEFIRRFDTEAKAASSLDYANIVKVIDVGNEGSSRYMVLEYVNGITLKELINKNGHLDWEVAVPIAIQIALALENAHKNGIVHRDIKPHNIIVTPDLIAKVTDFGIARAASANTVTLSGKNAMGSVHYFSPEQARGGIVGEQSDIYSLGILMYEMLTGKLPFDGDTSVSIALKHIQVAPIPPKEINSEIPLGLNDIVVKCIQKSTALRYKKARELVNELDSFMIDPNASYGYIDKALDDSKTTRITAIDKEPNFNKLRVLEASINQKNKLRKRERFLVFLSILITIGILASGSYYAYQWVSAKLVNTDADYTVENYVGSKVEDVKKRLDNAKINYLVTYEQNDTVSQGIVFSQSVSPGLAMRPGGGASIILKVSSGKDTVRLGDYKSKNYKLVISELTQILGLKVKVVKQLSGEISKDSVIGTIPGAGNDVPKGGEIQLLVSDGLINVVIPDILGKSRAEALKLLEESYLKIISEALLGDDPNLPEDKQVIIGVEPLPGTEVKALTGVIITLGSYEDFLNSKLPQVTPTPTLAPTPIITQPSNSQNSSAAASNTSGVSNG